MTGYQQRKHSEWFDNEFLFHLQHLLGESERVGDVGQGEVSGDGGVIGSLGAATVRVTA